jgi:hypothetical protein
VLWRLASIAIGAPPGNVEGGSSTGDFERWMKGALGKGCLSSKKLTAEGLEGAPLLGTLGYERKALETGIFLHGG